jgi:hypothetical protein
MGVIVYQNVLIVWRVTARSAVKSIYVAIVVSVKIVYTTEVCRCWLQESCVQLLWRWRCGVLWGLWNHIGKTLFQAAKKWLIVNRVALVGKGKWWRHWVVLWILKREEYDILPSFYQYTRFHNICIEGAISCIVSLALSGATFRFIIEGTKPITTLVSPSYFFFVLLSATSGPLHSPHAHRYIHIGIQIRSQPGISS